MRPARVLGVANPMSFPDDMSDDEIRAFLQQKFNADMMKRATGEISDALAPQTDIAAPYEPSLMEKASLGIGSALHDSGIISNRAGAQQIGKNVTSIGELLPGIGDVAAVDDFSRAAASGDNLGMGLAALGVLPAGDIAGKAVKKGYRGLSSANKRIDPNITWFSADEKLAKGYSDKNKAFSADLNIKKAFDAGNDKAITTPQQLADKAVHQMGADGIDKKTAALIKEDFLSNYPDPDKNVKVIDFWASDDGKENVANMLEDLGFDSVKLKEEGIETYGMVRMSDPASQAPVDVASSIKPADAMGEFTKFSDKVAARRGAKLSVWDLPTKGKAENIKHITDLQDYTPEQLVNQMKTLDNVGIRQGGYLKKGDGLDIFYKDNGTSDMIDPKTGNVVFANDVEQTGNIIKDDILNTAEGVLTPEQRATEFQARKANDAINNAREAALQDSYKMQHTAPMRGDNPSGDDLTAVFDKDIYTGNAKRFFGTGASYDDKAIKVIQGMKGKPEKSVTIYRAVPKDVKEINATDWITTTKEYAQDHMEGEKGWHILSKKVKAKDIATDGNSIHEFGYDPIN